MVVRGEVCGRSTPEAIIPVMARALLESAPSPRILDRRFDGCLPAAADTELLFSATVALMTFGRLLHPAVHPRRPSEKRRVSRRLTRALVGKIDRNMTRFAAALVQFSAERL